MRSFTYICILVTLNLFSMLSHAQSIAHKRADRFFENLQFSKSIKIYETLLEDNPNDIHLIKQLAYANHKIGNYQNALKYFSKFIDTPSTKVSDWFEYAQLLMIDGNYEEAKKWFEKYLQEFPNDELVKSQIEKLSKLDELKNTMKFVVRRTNKNTRFADMCPAIRKDNLVFSSSRDTFSVVANDYLWNDQPFLDLYTAGYHNTVIYEVKKFSKELNSPLHEGPVAFSQDGNTIFFTRNNLLKGKKRKTTEGINNLKIYIADWDGKKWIHIREFPFNSNQYSVGHPALSDDGKTIYFVSDMPGGYGKTDIYKSNLTPNGWSQPENVGPEINTSENEMFPTIDSEGNLYFSSNGLPGFGGLDIFIAIPEGNNDYLVQNLSNTLNSTYDDFSLVFDNSGNAGYFTSNRPYGEGSDDIYYFEKE